MKYAVICAGGPDSEIAILTEFHHERYGIHRGG